jgi:hypothetical protein
MYLACILGLCALLALPVSGSASSGLVLFALQEPQAPPSQAAPDAPSGTGSQPKQEQAPSGTKASDTAKSKTDTPKSTASKPPDSKRHSGAKKKKARPSNGDPTKIVVKHGSTAEPTTQLSPSITEEQALRQRETTNQLLSSTDATLQKIDASQLTGDQKDTVVQIRKFMEQAKAADAEGDPQRSYKLALKAHLLSDALEKQ